MNWTLTLGFSLLSSITIAQIRAPELSELIDSAINKNYILANKQLDIELSELDLKKLRDQYLPQVSIAGSDAFVLNSISLSTTALKIPALNVDIAETRNRFTLTDDLVSVNTSASILLYSGGKIPLLKKSLDQKIAGQRYLTEKEKQDIISEVVVAYDQLALLKQVRRVLDESEKRLAEELRIADKSFSYGLITKYERQKIEVAQAQVASRVEEYEGKRNVVQQRLFWWTNIPLERITLIDDTLSLFRLVPENNGIANRPDLKALNAFIRAQDFKIKAEKTWFVPKVQTAASLNYAGLYWGHIQSSKPVLTGEKLSAQFPAISISPFFSIGIGASWTLFDGNEGKNAVKKATLERNQLENTRKDLLENLELNLTKSNSDYAVSLTKVTLMQKQYETASNALTQAGKEYRVGLIRTSQLIEAEEDFENASLTLIQAAYDQRRATIERLKATGSLTARSVR